MPAFVTKYFTKNSDDIKYSIELQPLTSIHLHSQLGYELGNNRDINLHLCDGNCGIANYPILLLLTIPTLLLQGPLCGCGKWR